MRQSVTLKTVVLAVAVLLFSVASFADDVTLTLIPASGGVSGPAGSTVGWGYTITNNTSNWLETLSLDAGSFTDGTPNLIFDFPTVAPNSSVTETFSSVTNLSCVSPPCGLYEFTWDSNASAGTVNSGTFNLSSEYFNGDPSNPASIDLGPAPDASIEYSVTANSVGITPEPGTLILIATGICTLVLSRRRKWLEI